MNVFLKMTLFCSLIVMSVSTLGQTKEAILSYINLARTSPKKFVVDVLDPYLEDNENLNNSYAKSLRKNLMKMNAVEALQLENSLNKIARLFCEKSGKMGWADHRNFNKRYKRANVKYDFVAENLDFGCYSAKDVVVDLLIDDGIKSMGHRKNILTPKHTHIGIHSGPHIKWECVYVMSFGGIKK